MDCSDSRSNNVFWLRKEYIMKMSYKEAAEVLKRPDENLRVSMYSGEPDVVLTSAHVGAIEVALEALDKVARLEKELATTQAKLKESEPVVHAHWKAVLEPNTVDNYGKPVYHAECSACGCYWGYLKQARRDFKRCRLCGAVMDEEVVDA